MVEIRDLRNGRYEIYARGRHWEAFVDRSEAVTEGRGLAMRIAAEECRTVVVQAPWGSEKVDPAMTALSEARSR